MQGNMGLAVETLKILLLLQPDFSITWVLQNSGISGEMRERYFEGLRKAGVPEE